ncbi:MAG: hypothetical protein AB1547_06580 [Thermodesulfobacteriota bacterium]
MTITVVVGPLSHVGEVISLNDHDVLIRLKGDDYDIQDNEVVSENELGWVKLTLGTARIEVHSKSRDSIVLRNRQPLDRLDDLSSNDQLKIGKWRFRLGCEDQ